MLAKILGIGFAIVGLVESRSEFILKFETGTDVHV